MDIHARGLFEQGKQIAAAVLHHVIQGNRIGKIIHTGAAVNAYEQKRNHGQSHGGQNDPFGMGADTLQHPGIKRFHFLEHTKSFPA